MAQAFLVGRILVACYYLMGAFNHFANAGPLAILGGLLLLIGGLSFLLGAFPRVGVSALVLYFVPAVVTRYDIPNFGTNVALLGAALMLLAIPRPWPYSVERRLHLPVRAPV